MEHVIIVLVRKKKSYLNKRKRLKSVHVYNQTDINNLIKCSPLSMVIGDFLSLRKFYTVFGGRCPFCKTKTINKYHFKVSDKRHKFKCFECGIGGASSIGFIMSYYNICFEDALLFINKVYHKGLLPLRVERMVVRKVEVNSCEDLPF